MSILVQLNLDTEDAWHLYALLTGKASPKDAAEAFLLSTLQADPDVLKEVTNAIERLKADREAGQPGQA